MKFCLVNPPSDGNCFYTCIRMLLDTPLAKNLYALRNKAALYFLQNLSRYRPFLTIPIEKELCKFLKNKSWAHTIQIECLAFAFNVRIEVYRVAKIPKTLRNEFSLKDFEKACDFHKHVFNPEATGPRVRLVHINDNHFLAMKQI